MFSCHGLENRHQHIVQVLPPPLTLDFLDEDELFFVASTLLLLGGTAVGAPGPRP